MSPGNFIGEVCGDDGNFSIIIDTSIMKYEKTRGQCIAICEDWPELVNGSKVVNSMKMINATYSLITEYRYKCDMGFTYSKEDNVLKCTNPNSLFDLGTCLRNCGSYKGVENAIPTVDSPYGSNLVEGTVVTFECRSG